MNRPLLRTAIVIAGLIALAIVVVTLIDARPTQAETAAIAIMKDPSGRTVGTLRLVETTAGQVVLRGVLTGLPPGQHGIHLHAVGRCDPPAFTSAGAHLNPDQHRHGLANPAGPHAGDLPNLTVLPDRAGSVDATTGRVTLRSGPAGLLDADGSAIVVHAKADDQVTDPAGASGPRIACGVITRGGR